ncbi:3-ketoacyl-ACP reductase [Arcticibacterium luteifluviistationis]|uniref:3-ketoacyl-ACP reductase n=1 Tax=Arcticibacterium luteifluviistationis TaxID=1784714 RepID=A0A2Z4G8X6_9BACT|nr:3-ketoacyl-ACP reductase [Arcticibacterium luteifluviistationis]AWV97540.1 3-ketoacyl-ACP reductase [Arcticibacterium luteifluviistationis]
MKVALITGGSRGIGLGIAKALAEKGYALAINGVRDESGVTEVLNELKAYGQDVIYCQGDISKAEDRASIIQSTLNHYGHFNVLVNNAGVAPKVRTDMLEINEEEFDYIMNIVQKGTYFLSQKGANELIKLKKANPDFDACIINITSISARAVSVNRTQYCMAKASLSMMSKSFAIRMSEYGIPVYEVQPGVIETDMTAGVKGKYDKMAEDGLIPERRMGTPKDLGTIVAALATGQIPYTTGQIIAPDGGMGILTL